MMEGWLNIDMFNGSHPNYLRHNLVRPLPFNEGSVSAVYSEHFLEHLDEVDGFNLLQECYRVMSPGSTMRHVVPDLGSYVKLYLNKDPHPVWPNRFHNWCQFLNYATLGEAYYEQGNTSPLKYLGDFPNITNQTNPHRYLYDFDDIRDKLLKIGFQNVTRCRMGESSHAHLHNIDSQRGLRKNALVFIVEGTK